MLPLIPVFVKSVYAFVIVLYCYLRALAIISCFLNLFDVTQFVPEFKNVRIASDSCTLPFTYSDIVLYIYDFLIS